MTALLTLEEIKAHLRVDHDADDDMLMDKVRQATAVLLAYIQGSRDKVIREDGELIPGEALTRMKGAAMRLTGMLYRNPRNAFYWRFVEMGTVNMPPHPFVRPAFDVRSEQAAQVAIARMNRAIDEVLRR
ncbi:hypothetical protein B9S95_004306 [Escherichia coli]|nr:hypothetical protein [Escherichia coli]